MGEGRPSEYTQEVLESANSYINDFKPSGESVIPSNVGLALFLGKSRSTIYEWASNKPEFSDILERIQQKQHEILINRGLLKQLDSGITKLVLGKHGYHDRQEHTGAEGGPIAVRGTLEITFIDGA